MRTDVTGTRIGVTFTVAPICDTVTVTLMGL